ncbi:hypothetical protein JT723_04310 [Streptomyces bryophytorum]|nr:hypothetical protein [Actinacidiphila bryophytorum]
MQQLAYELRKLRVDAGSPTYREMAAATGCGASTLSQAAGGTRLPSLPTLRAYVTACGGDAEVVEQWEQRWREAATGETAAPPPDADTPVPYRGLRRFEAQDSELYFGREDLVARLVETLGRQRLVAVVGASGSGKSSLLRAGLVPALRSGQGARPAAVRILTPGPHPAAQIAARAALVPPAEEQDGDAVVIVDQFEEVFTLGAGSAERAAFLDLLLTAARPGGRLRVVIAVRADFFGRCAEHPGLAEALRDATLLVAPMGPAALREVIVKPAAAAGLIVERSLTARIVREAEKEPGSLPLVSHALLETWRRRRGRALTEEMYEAAGGIHGAIAATAESLYARLSPSQAATARHILLRLVTPGDGAQDTRRPTSRAELAASAPPAEGEEDGRTDDDGRTGVDRRTDVDTVLEMLLQARLVTADGEVVDLAHEAVISAWPRLRGWVEEGRERLRLVRHLTEAAQAWEALERDPGALYRGSRLAAAGDAFGAEGREGQAGREGREGLTALETAFLDASTAARAYEVRMAARATRRLRALTLTLSFLLVLAVTAGTVAWRQSRVSDAARRAAVAVQQVTLSRQLAAQSASVMSTDTELGMLLAVQAYRVSPTPEATDALYRAAAVPMVGRVAGAQAPVVNLVFSHDGSRLAWTTDDGSVTAADVATGRARTVLPVGTEPAGPGGRKSLALAFSADDRSLVSGSNTAHVRTTDLASGRTRTVVGGYDGDAYNPYPTYGSQLSADGRTMVTYAADDREGLVTWNTATGRSHLTAEGWRDLEGLSPDGRVVAAWGTQGVGLWDTATGRRLTTFAHSAGPAVFSRDGHTVALSGETGGVAVWHWTAGHTPTTVFSAPDTAATVTTFGTTALSPDGGLLAAGSTDGAVHLWNTATGRSQTLLNDLAGAITSLAFSADGHTLAAGMADGTVRLFDTTGTAPVVLASAQQGHAPGERERDYDVAFAEQGRVLAAGSSDGTVHLWKPDPWRRAGALGTPDAKRPVQEVRSAVQGAGVLGLSGDGTLRLWDAGTGKGRVLDRKVGSAALSADGRTVAANLVDGYLLNGGWNSVVHVWGTAGGQAADPVEWKTALNTSYQFMALSPDGRSMAVRGDKYGVNLLSTATGRVLRSFPMPVKASDGPLAGHPRYPTVAFSSDGGLLAAGGNDGTTWLWDTASGAQKAALTASTSPATAVAFSADTRTLAVAATDGTLRLWDVETRQVRVTLNTGPSAITSVAFSPDGTKLAAAAGDGTLLAWKVALPRPEAAVTAICGLVHRAPTEQETARYLPQQHLPAPCPQR